MTKLVRKKVLPSVRLARAKAGWNTSYSCIQTINLEYVRHSELLDVMAKILNRKRLA